MNAEHEEIERSWVGQNVTAEDAPSGATAGRVSYCYHFDGGGVVLEVEWDDPEMTIELRRPFELDRTAKLPKSVPFTVIGFYDDPTAPFADHVHATDPGAASTDVWSCRDGCEIIAVLDGHQNVYVNL